MSGTFYTNDATKKLFLRYADSLKIYPSTILSLCLVLFTGCASTPQTNSLIENQDFLPRYHEIPNVPFIKQSENYCGPATLAMIANWAGLSFTSEELAPLMFTPEKKGTLQIDYISSVRRIGLIGININTLKNILIEVNHDHPIVVLQNLGSSANPIWHYAVIYGFDFRSHEITMHSGLEKSLKMDFSQFERTWQKAEYWALIILPTSMLPETSTATEVLSAVSSLERVNKNQEAVIAYENILVKWPDNIGALFGLGNSLASLHHYRKALQVFKKAEKLFPKSPEILNNIKELEKLMSF